MHVEMRSLVIEAAAAELASRGIDDFSVGAVATRSGVDPAAIHAEWRDRRVLLMDAMLTTAERLVPIPNTGSLREDLRGLAASLITLASTPEGRRRYQRMLASSGDADFGDVGADFWDIRFNAGAPILQRAADRGELRDDIDSAEVMRMFGASLYYDVIYHNTPVRPDYADRLIDIFVQGISRYPVPNPPVADL